MTDFPRIQTTSPFQQLLETGQLPTGHMPPAYAWRGGRPTPPTVAAGKHSHHWDDGDDDGDLGSLWDAIGQIGAAATQVTLPMLLGQAAGNASGPARGLAAINAFGQQAIQTLNQIFAQVQGRQLSPADAVTNAERVAGYLSNSQYVYQAQHGDDAAALQQFKATAASIVSQIRTLAASVGVVGQTSPVVPIPSQSSTGNVPLTTSPPAINPVTGQPIAQPIIAGVDNSTLFLVGGGLLLLLVLK